MMFAAVQTVTKPNPVRKANRYNTHLATRTTTREFFHAVCPLKSGGQKGYTEQLGSYNWELCFVSGFWRLSIGDDFED